MSLESALALIESVKDTKVLFIGETIIDEYRFVSPLAKPSKENILAVRFDRTEKYIGGVNAARAHAQSFCIADQLFCGPHIVKARYVELDEDNSRFLLGLVHVTLIGDSKSKMESLKKGQSIKVRGVCTGKSFASVDIKGAVLLD